MSPVFSPNVVFRSRPRPINGDVPSSLHALKLPKVRQVVRNFPEVAEDRKAMIDGCYRYSWIVL